MNVYPRASALHVAGALLPHVFLSSVCFYRFQFVFAVGGRSVFDSDGTFYDTAAGFFSRKTCQSSNLQDLNVVFIDEHGHRM